MALNRSRQAFVRRETKETLVEIFIDLDKEGDVEVETPIPFFTHMLESMLFHMRVTARIRAIDKRGFDDHHIVEDTAITLGQAVKEALGDKRGIRRFSSIVIPMDDALVLVAIDISGRGFARVRLGIEGVVGGLSLENVPHFIRSFAHSSGITIHAVKIHGYNRHHIVEALFKGLGVALHDATRVIGERIGSVKGVI